MTLTNWAVCVLSHAIQLLAYCAAKLTISETPTSQYGNRLTAESSVLKKPDGLEAITIEIRNDRLKGDLWRHASTND